jgi:hypothetical protein
MAARFIRLHCKEYYNRGRILSMMSEKDGLKELRSLVSAAAQESSYRQLADEIGGLSHATLQLFATTGQIGRKSLALVRDWADRMEERAAGGNDEADPEMVARLDRIDALPIEEGMKALKAEAYAAVLRAQSAIQESRAAIIRARAIERAEFSAEARAKAIERAEESASLRGMALNPDGEATLRNYMRRILNEEGGGHRDRANGSEERSHG